MLKTIKSIPRRDDDEDQVDNEERVIFTTKSALFLQQSRSIVSIIRYNRVNERHFISSSGPPAIDVVNTNYYTVITPEFRTRTR